MVKEAALSGQVTIYNFRITEASNPVQSEYLIFSRIQDGQIQANEGLIGG